MASEQCNLTEKIPRSEWAINKGMHVLQEQSEEKPAAKAEVAEAQKVEAEDDSNGDECKSRQRASKGWNCFQTRLSVCQHNNQSCFYKSTTRMKKN